MWISPNDDSGVGLNEGAITGFHRFWVARQLEDEGQKAASVR